MYLKRSPRLASCTLGSPEKMEEGSPEKIVLNLGGVRFETYRSTLTAFPGTKLCSLTEPQALENFDYDPRTKEFFFDRSARLFGQVLSYYRSGHLHCPADACRSAFEEELAFWEVPLGQLPPCCWTKLGELEGPLEESNMEDVEDEGHEGDSQVLLGQVERRNGQRGAWRKPQIWALLEEPFSSQWALCLAIISLLFNIGLIVLLCEETRGFLHHINDTTTGIHPANVLPITEYQTMPYLLYLELVIIIWFTAEFALRLTVCPDKKRFPRKPLNWVDFLSLFPVYIQLFVRSSSYTEHNLAVWLDFFRLLYILKLLKVFRLVETPLMLRVLPYMFRSLLRETLVLMTILVFEIIFLGVLFYYVERFEDLPSCLWWAVVTLTTVGYGDIHPISPLGQAVATCTALCGVMTIILPIPILSIKFKGYYDAAVVKEKMKRRKEPTS
nr:potassium voltage-gated channel subfamily C member 1-like isoform X3 [Pogona vitticeps]